MCKYFVPIQAHFAAARRWGHQRVPPQDDFGRGGLLAGRPEDCADTVQWGGVMVIATDDDEVSGGRTNGWMGGAMNERATSE